MSYQTGDITKQIHNGVWVEVRTLTGESAARWCAVLPIFIKSPHQICHRDFKTYPGAFTEEDIGRTFWSSSSILGQSLETWVIRDGVLIQLEDE